MEDRIHYLASVQPLYSDMGFDLYHIGSTRREWESNPWLLDLVASSPICRGSRAQHLSEDTGISVPCTKSFDQSTGRHDLQPSSSMTGSKKGLSTNSTVIGGHRKDIRVNEASGWRFWINKNNAEGSAYRPKGQVILQSTSKLANGLLVPSYSTLTRQCHDMIE